MTLSPFIHSTSPSFIIYIQFPTSPSLNIYLSFLYISCIKLLAIIALIVLSKGIFIPFKNFIFCSKFELKINSKIFLKICLFNTHNLHSVTDLTVLLLGELFIRACSPKDCPEFIVPINLSFAYLFKVPDCTIYQ